MFKFLPLISVSDITSSIYNAIVDPIMSSISTVISTVLTTVINNVLMPLLKPFFESIVEPILGLIADVYLSWIHLQTYYWYIAILKVIDVLESAFNIFGGVSKVTVNNDSDFLLNVFFTNSGVSRIFWSITLLAFSVSLVFGIIAVIRSSVDLDGKRPVGKVIGSIAKTGLTFLIVPFLTLFALNMTNVVVKKTNEILSMSIGSNTPSLGTILFLATTLEAEDTSSNASSTSSQMSTAEMAEALKNSNSTGTMAGFTDGVRAEYYSGEKNYWDTKTVMNDFNIVQVKTVLGLFMSLFVALMLIMCIFVFITRIFEVLLLYIASPFFVATIPLDDGAKFGEWRNMYIAKLLSGFGMLIGMKLYIMIVPIIMSSNLELSSVNSANMGLKVLFILGGAFAIYKSNSLLMQIINANVASEEAATAKAGLGFAMSAKAMGMMALRGMSAPKNVAKPQGIELAGNRNPNLNVNFKFKLTDKPNSTSNIRSSGGTNNKIEIGSHRRTNKSNVTIGSHREKPQWEKSTTPGGSRNSNVTIGSHGSRTAWKSAEKSGETRNSNVTIGSHGSRTTWKNAETPGGNKNSNVTMGSSTRATWTKGVVNKDNSSSTAKQSSNKVADNSKTTWKKAEPKTKKDENNKF